MLQDLKDLWDQGLPTAQIGKLLRFYKKCCSWKSSSNWLRKKTFSYKKNSNAKPDRKKARSPVMPKLNFEKTAIEEKEYIHLKNDLSTFS